MRNIPGFSRFSLKAAVVAMALAAGLAGCDGSANEAADPAQSFSGTWSVDTVTAEGQALEGDDLAVVRAMGIYLTLTEDGTAAFEMFGTEVDGTWEAESATQATLTLDEGIAGAGAGETTITLANERLQMEGEGQTMTFVKIDPSEKGAMDLGSLTEGSGTDESSEEGAEEEGVVPSATTQTDVASFTDFTELDVIVSDTDLFCVKVAGRGGYFGDVGWLISVENKGDVEFFANARSPFTVGEMEIEPNFSMVVGAHETGTGVLWFAADEVGEDQSIISGTIEISDKGGNVLGTCVLTL